MTGESYKFLSLKSSDDQHENQWDGRILEVEEIYLMTVENKYTFKVGKTYSKDVV